MDKIMGITKYFTDVETTKEHIGYFFSAGEALILVILGSLCGLKNVSQISQWAENECVKEFLSKHFGIEKVPCYYWLLCLLKMIEPKSLNRCLMNWVQSFLPDGVKGLILSFDGKTIRSTGKMDKYEKPMHIVSAYIAQLGITLASHKVDSKTNEVPTVRELLEILDAEGCMIVADAMHCQKETAALIVDKDADYLMCTKDNQANLKRDIEDYVQDKDLQKFMDKAQTHEQNSGRIEFRRAFICHDIDWLHDKGEWKNLACIGAINRQTTYKGKTTNEWHYYISSRKLQQFLLKTSPPEPKVDTLQVAFGDRRG